jgi:hypothetical protein
MSVMALMLPVMDLPALPAYSILKVDPFPQDFFENGSQLTISTDCVCN